MSGTKISIVRQVVLILLLFVVAQTPARAQTILKTLEPGIGYSQFKQWAIESKFVFEGFTKDSMLVRDLAAQDSHFTRIQIRFCGGDDYAGRASNITIQQLFDATGESSSSNSSNADKLIQMQRDYIEYLSGAADTDGKFTGNFSVRRDHNDGSGIGTALSQDGKAGFWEVGLFRKGGVCLLQTTRRKDSVCQ
jgi:hypothetical protein